MSRFFSKYLIAIATLVCSGIFAASADVYSDRMEAKRLLDEAVALDSQGDSAKAKALLDKALEIESVGRMTAVNIQIALMSVNTNLGHYADARKAYEKALALSPDAAKADQVRLMSSQMFWQTGDYEEGEKSIAMITTDSLLLRRDIQLSHMYCGQGRNREAIELLKNGLEANPETSRRNDILQNIGYIYWTMGELPNALDYLSEALDGLAAKSDSYEYNVVLENMALVLSQQGSHSAAVEKMAEAHKYFVERSSELGISLRKYAEVAVKAGQNSKALELFTQYFKLEQETLLSNLGQMTLQQRINFWSKERPLLSKCFMLEAYAPEFLFDVAMFRRQVSLLGIRDAAYLQRSLLSSSKDVRTWLHSDEAAIEIISYTDKNKSQVYAAIVLTKEGEARFVRLLNADEIYQKSGVSKGDSSLYGTIQNEGRESIDMLYKDSELGNRVWQPIVSVLPSNVKRIYFAPEGVFHVWGVENMPFTNSDDYELYRISSIAAMVSKPRTEKRDIAVDKRLIIGGLNYDALPLDSIVAAVPNREASRILRSRFGGDKVYFNYLEGTKAEADTIARISNALPYNEMSEGRMKSIIDKYRVVHIATHGYSLNTPRRISSEFLVDSVQYDHALSSCGLALTGANVSTNDALEDGLLSAREVCDLDLSNLDFVVMSACQTAKGELVDEGAAGLVRGFKNAGAKIILATLWSVNDLSTALFMREFYRQMSLGESPQRALRLSQAYLRENLFYTYRHRLSPATLAREKTPTRYETRYSDPYYWAPFILIDAVE